MFLPHPKDHHKHRLWIWIFSRRLKEKKKFQVRNLLTVRDQNHPMLDSLQALRWLGLPLSLNKHTNKTNQLLPLQQWQLIIDVTNEWVSEWVSESEWKWVNEWVSE
jgi:hypothetical protein